MDKEMIELLARRAGLEKALQEFPEEVAVAAEQASGSAAKINAPADPRAEPWPPMRDGSRLIERPALDDGGASSAQPSPPGSCRRSS